MSNSDELASSGSSAQSLPILCWTFLQPGKDTFIHMFDARHFSLREPANGHIGQLLQTDICEDFAPLPCSTAQEISELIFQPSASLQESTS